MKTVMIFGTFDIIHPGHHYVFKQAKAHGDKLLAVIARDQTVTRIKGKKPLHDEESRRQAVATSPEIDEAVLGDRDDPMKVIRTHQPDVICLGYDQYAFVDQLIKQFPDIKIIRLEPFHPDKFKSSKLQ